MLTLCEFQNEIVNKIPIGTELENPKKGLSTVCKFSDKNIYYIRGKSTICVAFSSLFKAYAHYKGRHVSSSELRHYAPEIFNSNARPSGHSCNCTFFFMLLSTIGLAGNIEGKGTWGNAFSVTIY